MSQWSILSTVPIPILWSDHKRFYEEQRSTDGYCPHIYIFFKLCFLENYCTGKKFSPFTKTMGNGFNSAHLSNSFLDVLFMVEMHFLLTA